MHKDKLFIKYWSISITSKHSKAQLHFSGRKHNIISAVRLLFNKKRVFMSFFKWIFYKNITE